MSSRRLLKRDTVWQQVLWRLYYKQPVHQQLRLRHDTLRMQRLIFCNINYIEIWTEAKFNAHYDLDYLDMYKYTLDLFEATEHWRVSERNIRALINEEAAKTPKEVAT